jgi:NAD(P)H-dependent flavin oxidoreductase YrpB (nitropropane dioxygenase family)
MAMLQSYDECECEGEDSQGINPMVLGQIAIFAGFTARWHGREGELAGAIDGEMARYRAAAAQGDSDTAVIFTGEGADLIDDVPSAGEIVTRLVAEAERALASAARHVV